MANKTVTVRPSGGDYTSLAAAITGEVSANPNLVTMAGILTILVEGDWSGTTDTTDLVVSGFTVNASYYVRIIADSTNRAGFSYDSSKYKRSGRVTLGLQYTRYVGLQSRGNTDYSSIGVTGWDVVIDSCHVSGGNNTYCIGGYYRTRIVNNIVVDNTCTNAIRNGSDENTLGFFCANNVVCNNTGIGIYGKRSQTDQTTWARVINNYSGGNGGADYDFDGTQTQSNNYSEDGSESISVVAYSTATFTSVTDGSEDFSLVTGSALIGEGTDLSSDVAYPFDWDITGAERLTWDVGAYYFEDSAVEIICSGTPSAEASGTPEVRRVWDFALKAYTKPANNAINFEFGEVSGIVCAGTPSSAASGSPSVGARVSCTGTASTEASGQPGIRAVVSSSGTPTTEVSGVPLIGARIAASGTSSTEASGSPALGAYVTAIGTATTEASGSPVIAKLIQLSGQVLGNSTVLGALTTGSSLNGNVTGTSNVTGAVTVNRLLSGAVEAVSNVTGNLSLVRALSGAITAQSTVNGTGTVRRVLLGTVQAVSTVIGDLSMGASLVGSVHSLSTVAGDVVVPRALSGAVNAISQLTGTITLSKLLEGLVSAQATVAGSVSVIRHLLGGVEAVSQVNGSFSKDIALVGNVVCTSTVVGAFPQKTAELFEAQSSITTTLGGNSGIATLFVADSEARSYYRERSTII